MSSPGRQADPVTLLSMVVARLEQRLSEVAKAADPALPARVEELAGEIAGLARIVAQMAGASPAAGIRSWFDLTDPAEAEAMLTELIPWARLVLSPQLGTGRLPLCWIHHPALVEELLRLHHMWADAYRNPAARPGAAIEWQQRWLPGVLNSGYSRPGLLERGGVATGTCSDHKPAGEDSYQQRNTGQRRITTREREALDLQIAGAYAQWWVARLAGDDAGPEPGVPVAQFHPIGPG